MRKKQSREAPQPEPKHRHSFCEQHGYSAVCWPCARVRFCERGEWRKAPHYRDGWVSWQKLLELGCDGHDLDEYLYRAFLDAVIWKSLPQRRPQGKAVDKDSRVRKFTRAPKLLRRVAQTLCEALSVPAIDHALLRAGYTLPHTRGYGADVAHLEEFAKRLERAIPQIHPVGIKPGKGAIRDLIRFVSKSTRRGNGGGYHDQDIADLLNAVAFWFADTVGKRTPSEMFTGALVREMRRTRTR